MTKFVFDKESRNQECTFAFIASLIEDKRVDIEHAELEKISSLGAEEAQESPSTAVGIREEYQYGTEVTLKNNEYDNLLALAKSILDKTKEAVEE